MKNIIKSNLTRLIYSLSFLWIIISCTNYLDVKPQGTTIPKTPKEFDVLIQTILNNMDYGNNDVLFQTGQDMLYYESYADNLDGTLAAYLNRTSFPYSISIAGHASRPILRLYSEYPQLYAIIRNSNIVIDNLTDTEESRKTLGVAYTLRAVAYYRLMTKYCEAVTSNTHNQLGLPLVYTFDMEARPLRSTLEETIIHIERDLLKAITYKVAEEDYRFTEDVARAFLAKLYFWTEDWNKAITHSEYILEKYPLIEGAAYIDMMTSRFPKKGNVLIKSELYPNYAGSDVFPSLMEEVRQFYPLTKDFISSFSETNADIRYSLFIEGKRKSIKTPKANIRSAEFCLILAEAYAHTNNSEKALFYLNHLRAKRIENYTDYTISSLPAVDNGGIIKLDAEDKTLTPLTQAILNERRKELYMEGDRFFELKRNGSPEFWVAVGGNKVVTEKFMYTFPLPARDIILEEGLIQNPGYRF